MTFTAEATDVDLQLPDWAKGKTFKDTSSIEEEVDGKILSYEWSGAVSGSGESVSETFEKAGTYHATVTVKCDDDESVTASVTVKVRECPVCKKLKEEKARLETQLSQKRTKLEEVERELKDKYKRKIEITQRLQEINEELDSIAEGGMLTGGSLFVPPENKWKFLLDLLKVPFQMYKDSKRLEKLWSEKLELLSEKKEVEKRIEELESQRDRLKDEIADIEARIKEIDENIASCKFPPTH